MFDPDIQRAALDSALGKQLARRNEQLGQVNDGVAARDIRIKSLNAEIAEAKERIKTLERQVLAALATSREESKYIDTLKSALAEAGAAVPEMAEVP